MRFFYLFLMVVCPLMGSPHLYGACAQYFSAASSQPLRVAVVHYHLKKGGVTRVIDNAVSSLQDHNTEIKAFVGEKPAADAFQYPDQVSVIPELGYREGVSAPERDELLAKVEGAVQRAFGGRPDIWHFHNHHLGKNLALTSMVEQLARRGERIVLQLHDFPEDGRPGRTTTRSELG